MSNGKKKRPILVADRRSRASAKPKAAPKRKRTRAPAQGSNNPVLRFLGAILRWIWAIIWGVSWRVTALVMIATGLAVAYTYTTLPDVGSLLDGRARGSVTMLDRNKDVFAWRGDQFGGVVTADSVSVHLKNAVVATEDKRFYSHFGISPRGVASAVRINLSEGRGPLSGHGGSTITQQSAKLLCLGVKYVPQDWESESAYVADCRRTSLWRKVKEAVFSMAMEVKYTKDEILSIYLNRAYMGSGAYGAEAAAKRYFGKPSASLNPQESAMIAGLLTAPTRLAPTNNLKRSQDRAATILRLMNEQGYLTNSERQKAQSNPARLSKAGQTQRGGYFADWVMASGPEYFTRDTTEDVTISTTLDPIIQDAAEGAMLHIFETKVREGSKAQAAIVVMSADGAVRAMVGGRDVRANGAFNRATQAKRQTGSAFKPFVYATALELGYSGNDTVIDEPYCLNVPGSGEWCPRNYTNEHYGRVSLEHALRESLNVPAVKISEAVGRDLVRRVASDFGIESDLADGPALALGASESTLLEMTGAYAGILNGGSSVTPYGLVDLRLKGDAEPLMGTSGGIGERVIRQEAAQQLIYLMSQVVQSGTGQRAQLEQREVAGKTGTTQAARDAWFLGFSADYVAGVWMGYDDNTPLTGVTGGGLPAEIWREAMTRVHQNTPVNPLPMVRPKPKPVAQNQPTQQQRTTNRQQRREKRRNLIEGLMRDLLGSLGNR